MEKEKFRLTRNRIIKTRMRAQARILYSTGKTISQVQQQVEVGTRQMLVWLRDILRPEDKEA